MNVEELSLELANMKVQLADAEISKKMYEESISRIDKLTGRLVVQIDTLNQVLEITKRQDDIPEVPPKKANSKIKE